MRVVVCLWPPEQFRSAQVVCVRVGGVSRGQSSAEASPVQSTNRSQHQLKRLVRISRQCRQLQHSAACCGCAAASTLLNLLCHTCGTLVCVYVFV